MALARLIFASSLLALCAAPARASGGGYDETPPTLDYYLQRLPAKSIQQILAEMPKARPKDLPEVSLDDVVKACGGGSSPALTKVIDQALAYQRAHYEGPTTVNVLLDLRDLAATPGVPGKALKEYAQWRADHLSWFERNEGAAVDLAQVKELEDQLKAAPPALKPHWQYLLGALYFKNVDDTTSERHFDAVLALYPKSPKAETALFMKARCKFSQTNSEDAAGRAPAREAFEKYLAKYPKGQFVGDANGWLAGIAYQSGQQLKAIGYLMKQTDLNTQHPELFLPAVTMIEKCLAGLSEEEKQQDYDAIAKHPPIAMALAYMALNASLDSKNEDSGDDAREKIRSWRRTVLPKLGAAVLANKELYTGVASRARYFTILAQAAGEAGDQKRALSLVNVAENSGAVDDDLLFAKGLAQQRSGNLEGAEQTYRRILHDDPKSPLTRGVHYRLGLVLHDRKKEGDALLEFAAMRANQLPVPVVTPDVPAANPAAPAPAMPTPATPAPGSDTKTADSPDAKPDADAPAEDEAPSAIGYDYSGAPDAQVDQTMDALLNFAAVESLETALDTTDPEREGLRRDLRQVLRQRCLAHDDFENAARFAADDEEKEHFKELAKKSEAARAPGAAAAPIRQELARYWAEGRKTLTVAPLDLPETRESLFLSGSTAAGLRRRTNALAIAYPKDLADQELEGREELQHAVRWWDLALQEPTPEEAPGALWKIIEAKRTIAEVSPYTVQRAQETGSLAKTKSLYETLVRKYPDSREAAALAAYWTLPKLQSEAEGGYGLSTSRVSPPSTLAPVFGVEVPDRDGYYNERPKDWKTLCEAVIALPQNSRTMDGPAFAQAVTKLLGDARKMTAESRQPSAILNCLEDLALMAAVPGVDARVRSDYVLLRVNFLGQAIYPDIVWDLKIPPTGAVTADTLEQDPQSAPIRDFIAVLKLAAIANQRIEKPTGDKDKTGDAATFTTRDYPLLVTGSEAFLRDFPKSPKREVAHLLWLRGMVTGSVPKELPVELVWPQGNLWEGELTTQSTRPPRLDRAKVDAALKEYWKEFPSGEYASSVRWLTVEADLTEHRWGAASDGLLWILDESRSEVVRAYAAGATAELFDDLDKAPSRAEILQAILARPAMRDYLKKYLEAGGLPYLQEYLQQKLGAKG